MHILHLFKQVIPLNIETGMGMTIICLHTLQVKREVNHNQENLN